MALQKQLQTSTGHLSDYWRLLGYSIDIQNRVGIFRVGLYRNQAARNAGAKPIDTVEVIFEGDYFVFTPTNLNVLNMNPMKLAYQKIKSGECILSTPTITPSWFTDATDVVESSENT